MFFIFCDDINFASFADNNTSYCIRKTPEEVINQWEKSSKSVFEWSENKGMKDNPDMCHLLLTLFRMGGGGGGKKPAPLQFFLCNFYKRRIWPSKLPDF